MNKNNEKNTEEFSYVKPCFVMEKELMKEVINDQQLPPQHTDILSIPDHLKNQNMVIEINGGGKQIFKTYYSS